MSDPIVPGREPALDISRESAISRGSDASAPESADSGGSPTFGATAERAPAAPRVEAASVDLTAAADATPLPGAHRGGFSREFTGPVAITVQSAPVEPGTEEATDFTPAEWVATPSHSRFGAWALTFAIVGLLVSFLVGWGFLLGIVAIVAGVVALRRGEPRGIAIWAIALAALSIVYSAGWLIWAASQGALAAV
jgi:hypothetical protein